MAQNSTTSIRAGRAFVELFADDSKLVRGLRRAEKKVKAFGDGVRNLGLKMMALGTAIAAPLLASGTAFGDFETQMKMVSTMLDEPEKHMDTFTQGIRKLAVEFGESTDVLAKGLYDLLSASVDPARALDVLRVATKAAKGGMTDTAVAVDGLTSVLNAFGMSAGQAGHVADVMFQTVKRGKLTFPDLAANIGKVAPMARAAGMSMEDMMAAIATMTRQGLSAEEATTRLVNILKAAPDQAGNIAALIQKYVGKSLSEIQVDFPEVRAAGGIAALAADMEGFTKDLDLMQNAAGRADEAFALMTGGLSGELKKNRMAVIDLMVSVGEALAPTLKAASKWFRKVVAAVGQWVKQNQKVIVTVLKVAAMIVAVGIALVMLGTIISGVGSVVGALITVIVTVGAVLKVLAAVIAFMVSPIGLVISAVAAMAGYLIYASGAGGKTLAWLGTQFQKLSAFATASFQGISDALMAGDIVLAAKVLWLSLKVTWQKGVLELLRLWEWLKGGATKIVYGMWYGLQAAWEIGVSSVAGTMLKLYYSMMAMWEKLATGVMNVWDGAVNWVAKRIIDLWGLVDDTLDTSGAKAMLDSESQGRIDQRNREKDAALADIDRERQGALKAIADEQERKLARIGQASLEAESQIDAASKQKIDAAQRELEAAKAAWQQALDEARNKRLAKDGAPDELGGPDDIIERARRALDGMDELIQQEAAKVGVKGTFNAAAVRGLAAGDAADRTARATEETAKHTKKLVQAAQTGGLTFA